MNNKNFTSLLLILFICSLSQSTLAQQNFIKRPYWLVPKDLWSKLVINGNEIGPDSAPVTVVEFSDFECPHCAKFEKVLEKYRRKFPKHIKVILHNFPLPQHKWALDAAKAAEGVKKYGNYAKFVSLLFENQDTFSKQPWDHLAQEAGVKDMKAFHAYIQQRSVEKKIQNDVGLGMMIRLQQTPTIIINRMLYSGGLTYQEFTLAVNKATRASN